MSPPITRPFPCFIADSPQEGRPYGQWAKRLEEEFAKACEPHADEAGAPLDPETIRWFPERGWGGRVYVPGAGRATEPTERRRAQGGRAGLGPGAGRVLRPRLLRASRGWRAGRPAGRAPTSPASPPRTIRSWKIDLSDDVIGAWRAEGDRGGDITLVWGLPLVRGAVAATAELDGEVLDQAPVQDGRFTLIAVDAVRGLRRRALPGDPPLGPHPAPDRHREPLRRATAD